MASNRERSSALTNNAAKCIQVLYYVTAFLSCRYVRRERMVKYKAHPDPLELLLLLCISQSDRLSERSS